MKNKSDLIAGAAIEVFGRYGLRKTTMADLAEAAGVSRQTLYNTYSNKEEVMQDAIRLASEIALKELRAAWDQDQNLSEKLESFFRIGPLAWYDLIRSTPDAVDMFNTMDQAQLDEKTKLWTGALAELLEGHLSKSGKTGLNAADLADFVYSTSSAAKTSPESRDRILVRLQTLKKSVVALVEG